MYTAYFDKEKGIVLPDKGLSNKVWRAEDLLSRLTHLILMGTDEDGELEFCGTRENWEKCVAIPPEDKVLERFEEDLEVSFA